VSPRAHACHLPAWLASNIPVVPLGRDPCQVDGGPDPGESGGCGGKQVIQRVPGSIGGRLRHGESVIFFGNRSRSVMVSMPLASIISQKS
jgi:hypothetical protein